MPVKRNPDRNCEICGKRLKPWQLKNCSQECRDLYHKKMKGLRYQSSLRLENKVTGLTTKYAPKVKRVLLTDEEQLQINRSVDDKHKMNLECRHIRPGDPEFDALAAQIIALDKIDEGAYYTEDFLGRY